MIIKDNKELKQKDFKNEKELQNYFEENLQKILGYKFVETEFAVGSFRLDTLAYDEESKSFRIIEYKNVKNHSLVDQGYTYLKLLLERKADFVLKYNEKNNSNLKLLDVDWSQSRIIFVSPIYTSYQLNATDFKNIPVDELRERINEIEKGKPVYLICQSGLRSYIASRILEGNGYETYNFSGGFRFYDAVVNDRALIERAYACGMDY